jgi:hypothetical protein
MIIKQVDNESDPRSYSPNSDFVYVRVGNYLRTSRNLVIVCFYLNTNFEAERYLVYQASTDNTNRVCAQTAIRRLF